MSDQQEKLPDPVSEESPPAQKKSVEIGGRSISIGALAAWIGVFALLALLAFGLLRNQEGPVTVGEMVPNFTLTTFDGEQISLEELENKVVVLNFWASWCKPCEEEAALHPSAEASFTSLTSIARKIQGLPYTAPPMGTFGAKM